MVPVPLNRKSPFTIKVSGEVISVNVPLLINEPAGPGYAVDRLNELPELVIVVPELIVVVVCALAKQNPKHRQIVRSKFFIHV